MHLKPLQSRGRSLRMTGRSFHKLTGTPLEHLDAVHVNLVAVDVAGYGNVMS
jgi:hypothetical protein